MKKILLIIVLLVQTLQAQVFRGESDIFGIHYDIVDSCDKKNLEAGRIRHYITASGGESTYIVISIPKATNAIDISKNRNVYIEYGDGTYFKTQVHSSETKTLSKPYARKKFFETIIECPIEENDLCQKRIKKIYLERDNGEEYTISIVRIWAKYLHRELPQYFAAAKKRAIKKKERQEFLTDTFGEKIPDKIQRYLEENYPQHSYSLMELDTVYLPYRSILLLDYAITEERIKLTDKIDEEKNNKEEYNRLLQQGDSIVSGLKEELLLLEDEYQFPQKATGKESDDYQRAIIELINYEGKDTITLHTRISEESFTTTDFWEAADKCWEKISEFEELLDWIYEELQEDK